MTTPTLSTERLSLVPLRPSDADEMATVLGDPALHAFIGGQPLDAEALRSRFARLAIGRSEDEPEEWHNWIVRRRDANEAIGTVQATVVPSTTAEISWVIGVPWQGSGYASEAARALVDWLLRTGVKTVEAHIHPQHAASEKVAQRAGLTLTEELLDGERVWRLSE